MIVFSSRACEALSEFLTEFELVRVEFHGLGIEKRSGVWHKEALAGYARAEDLERPFYYLHPTVTRLPGHAGPIRSPDRPGDTGEAVDLRALSKWFASVLHFQQNMQSYFSEYFSGTRPPAIFAFGNEPNIFFSDLFCAEVKHAGLKGFTFAEVARVEC